MAIKKEKIKVYDMTCTSCEKKIERTLMHIPGVESVKASFSEQCVNIVYDDETCNTSLLKETIKNIGYSTDSSGSFKFIAIALVAIAIIFLGSTNSAFNMQDKLNNATYLALFIVGIFTSIHCVGMCGGIMLSQSLSKEEPKSKLESMKPALLYNLGRIISYTILGAVVGALGSVFALSITTKALLQLLAGVFMIIMGMNMSGFSLFRKINLRLPLPTGGLREKATTPFLIGLLNGLMPCGPLQTMQLYALGTGSALKGALSLFTFALGTIPLMLTFGAVSSLISKGYTKKILKLSGVIVIVLGLIMGNRGLFLLNINVNPISFLSSQLNKKNISSNTTFIKSEAEKVNTQNGVQIINLTADSDGYSPKVVYAQENTYVKLMIEGKELNSCNNTIIIPSLNIEKQLQTGENIIEFNVKNKDINFSCYMGMIKGVIKITDNAAETEIAKKENSTTSSKSTSIYGNDITKVLTSRLVSKATLVNNIQYLALKGIGYELDPIIVIVNKNISTRLYLDLTKFDTPEGDFLMINLQNGETIASFVGKKDTVSIDYIFKESGGYAIVREDTPIGIIEVVDSLKEADSEVIRKLYIK
jgi:sulfite exporter TauE/SafE/plastocyanin domain-containing protein/copper chaperone CopZ